MKSYKICGVNGTIEKEEAKELSGDIIISENVTKIQDRLFYYNDKITSVIIPGSVKSIGSGAFMNCENLQSVTLGEGIEAIYSNAFTDCYKLRKITYPDSINYYFGDAFHDVNLEEPVMNVSKTMLVFCPESVSGSEWSVPDTVKIIFSGAFSYNHLLETVHLSEGIEIIQSMTFSSCGIREITIPRSVRKICKNAFCCCSNLEKITLLNPKTEIENGAFESCSNIKELNGPKLKENDNYFHLIGQPFLIRHLESGANLHHSINIEFKKLKKLCAKGDADAMADLADWFEKMSHKKNASQFYMRASNYWRYRAYRNGNKKAAKWFSKFFKEHPHEHLESILFECDDYDDTYTFSIPGKMMNDLGYDFFDKSRDYDIKTYEKGNVVIAASFESYDPPDEDGFGAETNYEWWFLDKNMQPIPGVRSVNASMRDRMVFNYYHEEYKKAADELMKREKKMY